MLTHTSRMGYSHITRYPNRLNQQDILAINIYESSYIPSVKVMDTYTESSAALCLPPKKGPKKWVRDRSWANSIVGDTLLISC